MTNDFLKNKQFIFDRWAPSYDWLLPSVFYRAVHQRLLEYANLPERANVLDLGCGTGRLLERLANQFPELRGTGLDLSPKMLQMARMSNRHHPRLIFVEGKAEELPFSDGQFDAVFNTISFLHYLEPKQVLQEVARVLKPGGSFYLVDITTKKQNAPQTLSISHQEIKFYSPQQREILGAAANFSWAHHHYLLGSVLLTVFTKQ